MEVRSVSLFPAGVLLLLVLASFGTVVVGRRMRPFASLPPINGVRRESYKVAPYLRQAARLQALGKDVACQELLKGSSRVPTGEQDEQIIILCRMLFQKRSDTAFRGPMLGAPCCLGGTDYSDWLLEPIELVDGVPFLVVRGYVLGGDPEGAWGYLRYCMSSCDWNVTAFRERTPEELRTALNKLLSSSKWKRPLDESERAFLSDQIR